MAWSHVQERASCGTRPLGLEVSSGGTLAAAPVLLGCPLTQAQVLGVGFPGVGLEKPASWSWGAVR